MILYIYTYKKSIETKYIEFYSKRELEGELRDPRIWVLRKRKRSTILYAQRERENEGGTRRRAGSKDFTRKEDGEKFDAVTIRRHMKEGRTGFLRRRGEFSYLLSLLLLVVWALRTYESKYGGSGCGASTANDSGCEWRSEWLWKHPRHQPRLPVFLL